VFFCQRRWKTGRHAGARVGQFSAAFSDGWAGVNALARALPCSWRVAGRFSPSGPSLRLSFCRGLGLTGTALAEAIAVAVNLKDADKSSAPVVDRGT
jgi:hypothetical protein